jgi:hypothetical protein
VAAQVLDDPAVREEALRNHHEEMITRLILAETPEQKKASQKDALKRLAELGDDVPGLYMRYDELQAADFHPGVSVVDVDADGLDDLYLMRRLGTNLLLRNRGDGSFEDVTKSHGLDVQNHSSTATRTSSSAARCARACTSRTRMDASSIARAPSLPSFFLRWSRR